jgi:hypothetical protein
LGGDAAVEDAGTEEDPFHKTCLAEGIEQVGKFVWREGGSGLVPSGLKGAVAAVPFTVGTEQGLQEAYSLAVGHLSSGDVECLSGRGRELDRSRLFSWLKMHLPGEYL